jgi:hypothetical protein
LNSIEFLLCHTFLNYSINKRKSSWLKASLKFFEISTCSLVGCASDFDLTRSGVQGSNLGGGRKFSITWWNIQPFTVLLAIAGVNHSQKMVLPHGRQKLKAKVVKLVPRPIACFKSHERPETFTYCRESSPSQWWKITGSWLYWHFRAYDYVKEMGTSTITAKRGRKR